MTFAVIAAAVVLLFSLGAFLIWIAIRAARKAGADAAERDRFREKSEQARKANEIDEAVVCMSDSDLDGELRDGSWR